MHFGGFWVGRGVLCGLLVCVYSRFDFGLGMFCVVWCYLVCFVTHRFSMVPLPCPVGLFCFVTSRLPRFHNKITPYYLLSSFYFLLPILTGPAARCPSLFWPGGGPGARAERENERLWEHLAVPVLGSPNGPSSGAAAVYFVLGPDRFPGPKTVPEFQKFLNFRLLKSEPRPMKN